MLSLTGCALAAGLGDFLPAEGGSGGGGDSLGGGGSVSQGGGGSGGADPCADDLLISEARTNGTEMGTDDFIEIYNPTTRSMSLEGISVAARTPTGGVNERWRGVVGDSLGPKQHFLIVGETFDDGPFDVKLASNGSFPNEVILLLRRGPKESSVAIDIVCLCTNDCDSGEYESCGDVVLPNPAYVGRQILDIDDSVRRVPECMDENLATDFETGAANPTPSP